jgi:hypothetical protein
MACGHTHTPAERVGRRCCGRVAAMRRTKQPGARRIKSALVGLAAASGFLSGPAATGASTCTLATGIDTSYPAHPVSGAGTSQASRCDLQVTLHGPTGVGVAGSVIDGQPTTAFHPMFSAWPPVSATEDSTQQPSTPGPATSAPPRSRVHRAAAHRRQHRHRRHHTRHRSG